MKSNKKHNYNYTKTNRELQHQNNNLQLNQVTNKCFQLENELKYQKK